MPMLRIAKITYDHHELTFSKNADAPTIGEQIDKTITEMANAGELINEIAIGFEGIEDQHRLMTAYRDRFPTKAKKAY